MPDVFVVSPPFSLLLYAITPFSFSLHFSDYFRCFSPMPLPFSMIAFRHIFAIAFEAFLRWLFSSPVYCWIFYYFDIAYYISIFRHTLSISFISAFSPPMIISPSLMPMPLFLFRWYADWCFSHIFLFAVDVFIDDADAAFADWWCAFAALRLFRLLIISPPPFWCHLFRLLLFFFCCHLFWLRFIIIFRFLFRAISDMPPYAAPLIRCRWYAADADAAMLSLIYAIIFFIFVDAADIWCLPLIRLHYFRCFAPDAAFITSDTPLFSPHFRHYWDAAFLSFSFSPCRRFFLMLMLIIIAAADFDYDDDVFISDAALMLIISLIFAAIISFAIIYFFHFRLRLLRCRHFHFHFIIYDAIIIIISLITPCRRVSYWCWLLLRFSFFITIRCFRHFIFIFDIHLITHITMLSLFRLFLDAFLH